MSAMMLRDPLWTPAPVNRLLTSAARDHFLLAPQNCKIMLMELYHGTDVPSAMSILRTELRPRSDWAGRPEDHWTLAAPKVQAWNFARSTSERTGRAPAIVICNVPQDYILATWDITPSVRFHSLRRPLPSALILGMENQEPVTLPPSS
jgi:hypothetical protein